MNTNNASNLARPEVQRTLAVAASELADEPTSLTAGAIDSLVDARGMYLGHVVWLMTQTVSHRHLFVGDCEWRLFPPLLLRQFRLWKRNGRPHAYVSWALVTSEIAERFGDQKSKHEIRLKPSEWYAGKIPLIVDVIAPKGDGDRLVAQVRESILADKSKGESSAGPTL